MKKIELIFIVVFFTMMSCKHFITNTELVKQSVLDFDYSTSVGDALDNYQYFSKTKWEEFTTDQGREVVQFLGYYECTDESGIDNFFGLFDAFQESPNAVQIQFLLNKDRREDNKGSIFKVAYEGVILDGDEEVSHDCLSEIYQNKPIYITSFRKFLDNIN